MAFMFQEQERKERYEIFSLFTYFLSASRIEGAITCFTSKWLIFLLCNNITVLKTVPFSELLKS